MKKIFNKNSLLFFIMFISLLSYAGYMDIYTRSLIDINTYNFNFLHLRLLWLGFSIFWILLLLLIVYFVPRKRRVKVFSIINIIVGIIFVSQICYVQQLGKFMVFSDLFLAGEGLQYISSVLTNLNPGMIITVIFEIICLISLNALNQTMVVNANKKKLEKANSVFVIIVILIAFSVRGITYFALGDRSSEIWQENYNIRNIYDNYTDPNTSMYSSGLYEYHVRAVFKYFYNIITLDKTLLKGNIDEYNNIYGTLRQDNEYTGLFKDKNVIYVMMESIDSWIIDDDTMPNLKHIMDTGYNFTNRYSPFFNGGQTINSEFALNSGLYAISSRKTIYDIDDIDYNYSLANTLKNNGYNVNSFHANTGEFYSRSEFHGRLGYTNHYSAKDMQEANILNKNTNYFIDSNFIGDDTLFDLMTSGDKFMSFYTTYSAHLEYTNENKIYKSLEKKLDVNKYEDEEYIYRTLASDTDKALGLLISRLKEKDLLDDTVLVLVSDHYVYGYSDSEFVANKKGVKNTRKLLQNTPFVIWSSDIEHKEIDTILDTADILPTVLNLLGIDYNANNYIGDDVFSNYHDEFVWFSDGSYIASDKCALTKEAILTKSNYNINKNRNILITNYYGE